jgi:hypothetical protein
LSGTAARYVDFAILRGDPSDGLPGVAGVGEKTAARLVRDYPSLDALVAGRDRLPARVAGALAGAGEYLDAMRVVVPVATRLDVSSTAPASPTWSACRSWPGATRSAARSAGGSRPCATPASPAPSHRPQVAPAPGSAGRRPTSGGAPSAGDARPRTLAWFLHRLDTVSSPSRGLLRLA